MSRTVWRAVADCLSREESVWYKRWVALALSCMILHISGFGPH